MSEDNSITHKYTNHTETEIEQYLNRIKKLILMGKMYICINREKNRNFIKQYNINSKKQKEIFLSLTCQDFCYSVDDRNTYERLYVFSKGYNFNEWGEKKNVSIYIKMLEKKTDNGEVVVIISLHEKEKDIEKLFLKGEK